MSSEDSATSVICDEAYRAPMTGNIRTIAQSSPAYAGGVLREEESAWQANAEPLAAEAWYLCLFHILIFFFNLRVFIKE